MLDMPIAIIENLPASSSGPEEYIQAETVYPLPDGFVYLDEALPGVFWDAKYATADNFTGEIVEGYASNRVALSADCAAALAVARDIAAEEGYRLLVWDAARPQRAVDDFVAWSKRPEDGKTKDAHYPNLQKRALIGEYVATRSGHSRGAAIRNAACSRSFVALMLPAPSRRRSAMINLWTAYRSGRGTCTRMPER